MSKRTGHSSDAKHRQAAALFETVGRQGSIVVNCGTEGKAYNLRHRCYAYRVLVREEEEGATELDWISIKLKGSTLAFVKGEDLFDNITTLDGEKVEVPLALRDPKSAREVAAVRASLGMPVLAEEPGLPAPSVPQEALAKELEKGVKALVVGDREIVLEDTGEPLLPTKGKPLF